VSDAEILLGSDRTEDLTADQVMQLFAYGGNDHSTVASMMAVGTHLLSGSRGTGKTMLLRMAHEKIRRERPDTLPIFVSFSRYLSTYNATSRQREGYSPFQSWIFAKILSAIQEAILASPKGGDNQIASLVRGFLEKYIQRLESHHSDATVTDPNANAAHLGISCDILLEFARLDKLREKILAFLDRSGYSSVYLFLDEAAQSFAEELQPEFFQLIKHLRHNRISIKAAVYPHATVYGVDFDIGQDAIVVPIERPIESPEGMIFFDDLIKKRFEALPLGLALAKSEIAKKLLIKMSGGNPRWFIHLLGKFDHASEQVIPVASVIGAAKELPDSTLWPYLLNLRARLKSKRKYIDSAAHMCQILVEGLRDLNKGVRAQSGDRPTCFVAVSNHKTVPFRVTAALRILQYAGIISSRGLRKISDRESAEMFLLHPAIQVKENTLFGGDANPRAEALVSALTDPLREKFKSYTKNSPALMQFRQDDDLDAVVCDRCAAVLPSGSKFCFNCGTATVIVSPFREFLDAPSLQLELTAGLKQRLVNDGRFPTVGSVLYASDDDLDSIPRIGPERIKLIRYAAEEFISG
jgi:hypothetical protein